jgi:hypothetical protein
VQRRRFDHLFIELSVEVGRALPRYDLWLALRGCGHDPEALTRHAVLAFYDGPLQSFLRTNGLALAPRNARRLRKRLAGFDPRHAAPEEIFARL